MSHLTRLAVGIIGAGPYGLSIAAHLRSHGVEFRIFGTPMHRWQSRMPKGMFLKSEGCASNLFDPAGGTTLHEYCSEKTLSYSHVSTPVSLETFTQYGLFFQRRLVPTLEDVKVTALEKSAATFEVHLANGETVRANKVVVATGMSHTAYIPKALSQLPTELVSHSESHHDLSRFNGRDVTVVGGGQSALETAALLYEIGADVRLLVRQAKIRWNGVPKCHRSAHERMRRPMSNLGPGLGPWIYSNLPALFYYLPREFRIARAQKALGPAGAWWLKERIVGRVPVVLGNAVCRAETHGTRVLLHLQATNGVVHHLTTDHVIAATGYRFALQSLPFFSQSLLSQLRCIGQAPILSRNFESSIPGLYFTGLASATQFGPAMRFLHGAGFTARQVSCHIAGKERRFEFPLSSANSCVPKCQEF